jgi:hypothetical protein
MAMALPLSERRNEHGSWCFFSRDHADHGITFSQTVSRDAAWDAWQCRVSLSGGGSRALTAGMGQLRALNKLTANDQSLLAQVKALSTVSGGSWLGVPFTYLPPESPSDAAYLGPWIE